MANPSTHSILVIGCGSIGERHLRCFQKTGRAEVTACDSNAKLAESMAARYGVRTAPNWEDALATGRHTAAIVCTPAPWHIPMGSQALRSGLHVLLEKPLSTSLAGVADLLRLHAQSGQAAAVAYVLHQYPMLAQARAFLERGELGRVLQVATLSGQPFHRLRPGYAQSYYRDRQSGGGAIQDALTHTVNWVESVIGPADSVLCDCAHLGVPDVTVEDTVHVSARHGQTLANYTLNQFQAPNETTLQLNAERGSVKIEFHNKRWGFFRENDAAWTWCETPMADRDAPFLAQANSFLDRIEGKPATLCSLQAGADTLRFNLAALASAQSGHRVACQDIA
jgi:predicted dehydrogenase